MSAHMVSDETINKIVAGLTNLSGIKWRLTGAGYDLYKKEDRKTLGVRMFVLNCKGVNARYGKNQAKEFRALDYAYIPVVPAATVNTLKALQCLLYQAAEGCVPETRLYKLLRGVEQDLMHDVINQMPEYQNAPWG